MCFDTERPDAYGEEIRKARKPHRCDGCQREILAGDLYVSGHGIFDGEAFSLKVCGACEHTRERIHEQELEEGCRWDESWIDINEITDYCIETGFLLSTIPEGQSFLTQRKADRKLIALSREEASK